MLDATHRFHGRTSLNYAHRAGRSTRSTHLLLKYAANDRRRSYRAAVVVGRKISKSAVVRNRLRRRIYAVLRELLPANAPNYDLIFLVLSEATPDLSPTQLTTEITKLLNSAGLPVAQPSQRGRAIVKAKET
jgi:ribonuclease P protein component